MTAATSQPLRRASSIAPMTTTSAATNSGPVNSIPRPWNDCVRMSRKMAAAAGRTVEVICQAFPGQLPDIGVIMSSTSAKDAK